jgi:hypothetical protein
MRTALGLMALLLQAAALQGADVEVGATAQLVEAARRARPGTRIVLTAKTYRGPCKITGVRGRAGAMIRIVARDPAHPPTFSGGTEAFQLIDCRYVEVSDLIAEKATVNNVQVGNGSHHVILRNVVSRDIAGRGNCDGMKLPDLTDFLVYNCTVANWGAEGSAVDMVGCARGLFMKCRFRYPSPKGHTANTIQPKGGTFNVGVYQCRFDDAKFRAMQFGGRTGKRYFFRGNYEKGHECYDAVAMGNVITGGEAALALVSCTRCTFAYNTIVDPGKYICRALKEGTGAPGGNVVERNLIVHGKLVQHINSSPGVDLTKTTFRENYWFNRLKPEASVPKLAARQVRPAGGTDPRLDADFRPAAEAARAYGAHAEGIRKAWAEHTKKFEWAWRHARRIEKETEAGPRTGP